MIVMLDKQQNCDPITVKSVTAKVSQVDKVYEKSSVTFSVTIEGPSKPKEVALHHKGMSSIDDVLKYLKLHIYELPHLADFEKIRHIKVRQVLFRHKTYHT